MSMVVNGFIEPVTRTLPMEYAIGGPASSSSSDGRQRGLTREAHTVRGGLAGGGGLRPRSPNSDPAELLVGRSSFRVPGALTRRLPLMAIQAPTGTTPSGG